MAYTKTAWKARQGVNLNKFTKSQETSDSVLLTNAPDSVTEPGTPFSADNMNHIENGIADAHDAIEQETADRATAITEAVSTEAANRQDQVEQTNTRVTDLEANDEVQDSDIAQIWDQLNQTKHFRGYYATLAEIQALQNPEAGDFAYCAEIVAPSTTSNEWIFDDGTSTWADTGRPIPDQLSPPSDALPLMDGKNANAGSSNEYSRGDHIHPRHPDTAFIYTDPDTGERYDNEQLYNLIHNINIAPFENNKPGTIKGASEADGIGYVKPDPAGTGKGVVTGLVEMNSLLTMGPPDWSNRSNLLIPSPGVGTYAVINNGYLMVSVNTGYGTTDIQATLTINGFAYKFGYGNRTAYYGVSVSCFPVKKGDVVQFALNSGLSSGVIEAYFIPPVINPPAYLETMPLLDYSTVEQDTGRKWLDGKAIYQKTIVINGSFSNTTTWSQLGTVASIIPGATFIIKNDLVSNMNGTWKLGLRINGGNIQYYTYIGTPTPEEKIHTIWYTK